MKTIKISNLKQLEEFIDSYNVQIPNSDEIFIGLNDVLHYLTHEKEFIFNVYKIQYEYRLINEKEKKKIDIKLQCAIQSFIEDLNKKSFYIVNELDFQVLSTNLLRELLNKYEIEYDAIKSRDLIYQLDCTDLAKMLQTSI